MPNAMNATENPNDPAGSHIGARKVNGTNVYDLTGGKIGSIYDLMLDKQSGKVEYAVMSFGGFLGMGTDYHPMPWHMLTYDQDLGGFKVDIDEKRLEGSPAYDEVGISRDDSWRQSVDDFYGPAGRPVDPNAVVTPGRI